MTETGVPTDHECIAEAICNRRCGFTDNHAGHNHGIYFDHIEITAEHIAERIENIPNERRDPGNVGWRGVDVIYRAAQIARDCKEETPR